MTDLFTATQRKGFAAVLRSRYRTLWDEAQRELGSAEPYRDLAGETHDPEDEATADVLVDTSLANIHRYIGEMRDIQRALQRVSDGSYGTCADCGEEIATERLKVDPVAERCQPCQSRHERQYATARGPTL